MAVKRMEAFEFYRSIQAQGFSIEFISGKWFMNGVEYPLYGRGGLLNRLGKIFDWIEVEKNSNAFVKYIMEKQADYDGEWPIMPMLREAKEMIRNGYRVEKPLAYPLNEKELMILHYLVDGNPKDTYAIFFCGVGGSGKSTVCNLFASIFGDLDVSKCTFNALGEKFARETLAGKRLWYDSDIGVNWSETATNTLKKVISNEVDQFEQKGKNPYVAQYRCKGLFCCNKPPKFDITDTGTLRRLVYYFKNEKIQNPDGNMVARKYTKEELLDILIAALNTDISNFYEVFKKETYEVIMSGNNVAKYGMTAFYDTYRVNCANAGVHPFSKDNWETLKNLFKEWKGEQVDDDDISEREKLYGF